MTNKKELQNFIKSSITLVLVLYILVSQISIPLYSQTDTSSTSSSQSFGCVICPQVLPRCNPGEILVPQTCTQCAFCKPPSPVCRFAPAYCSSDNGRFCCNGTQPSCPGGFFLCTPTLNGTYLECCTNGSCSPQNVVCGNSTTTSSSGCSPIICPFGCRQDTTSCRCICTSSSSGQCITDFDCPPGICSNGSTYKKFSCISNQCIPINYFIDPCFNTSSSSSGSNICRIAPAFCTSDGNRFCCNGKQPSCPGGFFLCTPTLSGTILECCTNGSCSPQNVVCSNSTSSSGCSPIFCPFGCRQDPISCRCICPTSSSGSSSSSGCCRNGCTLQVGFCNGTIEQPICPLGSPAFCCCPTTSSSSSSGCGPIICPLIACTPNFCCRPNPVTCRCECSTSSSSSSGSNICQIAPAFCNSDGSRFCCNGAQPRCPGGFFLCTPTLNGTYLECCTNGSCSSQNVVCSNSTTTSSSSSSGCLPILCPFGCRQDPTSCRCICPTTSSSSSGSSCPPCLPPGSQCPQVCLQVLIECDGQTYFNTCDYQQRKCGCISSTSSSGSNACRTAPAFCSNDGSRGCCNGAGPTCPGGFFLCTPTLSGTILECCVNGNCSPQNVNCTNFRLSPFTRTTNDTVTCIDGNISCKSGTPVCLEGDIPICGSSLGFSGDLAGPGCIDNAKSFYKAGAVSCDDLLRASITSTEICNKNNLCPHKRKRFEACREDLTSCDCKCSFTTHVQRHTPRCNKNDVAICPKGSIPTCFKVENTPVCNNGILSCQNLELEIVDLDDFITCK